MPEAQDGKNAHVWLAEPLMLDPSYVQRSMFGCQAVYLQGLLVLVLADTEEPWNGVLVATERAHQPELMAQFPDLKPHPILPKWLYLSAELDSFEFTAKRIVETIASGTALIGVQPKPRKARKKKPLERKRRSKGARERTRKSEPRARSR